jgi:hypothetical protein
MFDDQEHRFDRAIDQETANASGAHLSEGDLLAGEGVHAPIIAGLRDAFKRRPLLR